MVFGPVRGIAAASCVGCQQHFLSQGTPATFQRFSTERASPRFPTSPRLGKAQCEPFSHGLVLAPRKFDRLGLLLGLLLRRVVLLLLCVVLRIRTA